MVPACQFIIVNHMGSALLRASLLSANSISLTCLGSGMRAIGLTPGLSGRHGCNRSVFSERYERMDEAIAREKQIKGGSRARKIALIEAMNPDWKDLYRSLA